MTTDRQKAGCGILALGAFLILIGVMDEDKSPKNAAPVVSQPSTGPVRSPTYETKPQRPAYTPPPPTRAQLLDRNPTLDEPTPGLQSRAQSFGYDAQIKLENHLPRPAYVKVVNGFGTTIATLYLRSQEEYTLDIVSGTYHVKYASGPGSAWRGPVYYFGSSTSFHKGTPDVIGSQQILTLTFYETRTRYGNGGNTPSISEEEFDR